MTRIATLLLASLLTTGTASADTWQIDAAHSRVGFRVSHMMVSSVEGEFADVSGTLDYTVGDLKGLDVKVEVQMASVDTRNADRDNHLRAPDFFDVANHPTMTFTSKAVKPRGKDAFDIVGDLTLRGVTREVTLASTGLGRSVVDPWGNKRLGASATATIDRQDFGVSWNKALDAGGVLVGDDIAIRIDVEFVAPANVDNG